MSLISALVSAPPQNRGAGASFSLGGTVGSPRDAWMRLSTAYACVSLISQTMAAMPKRIVRRGDKSREPIRTREFQHLWGRPSPEMAQIVHWQAGAAAVLTAGNAYFWLDQPYPRTRFWWPIHPSTVRPRLDADGRKVFRIGTRDYGPDQVLHVPGLSLDGVKGVSVVDEAAARSLQLASVAENYAERGLRQNAVPPGQIKTDQPLTPPQAEEIQDRWHERHGGDNQGRVAVFGRGAEFKPITFTPEQMQYISLREHQREDILQWWRVPAHLIGLVDKPSTWGTGIEQLGIGFVTYTLLPWIVSFEQEISDSLLPEDLEFKFNVTALLRGDMKSRFEAYSKGRQWGWLSADTILELEDMPPRGIEDDFLSPTNMTRISVLGAPIAPPAPAAPQRSREATFELGAAAVIEAALLGGVVDHTQVAGRLLAPPALLAEARCGDCGKLLGKNVNVGAELPCERCRAIVTVEG